MGETPRLAHSKPFAFLIMNNGWIKLHRKIQKSDLYKTLNAVQRDVMIQCLLLANHKPHSWEWEGKVFEVTEGEFVTSLASLKKVCAKNVSIKNIRTALNKLERWSFLANKSTKTGRLIKIVNWGKYQLRDNETGKDVGKQAAKRRQSIGKEAATNKNDIRMIKNDIRNDELSKESLGEGRKEDLPTDKWLKMQRKNKL